VGAEFATSSVLIEPLFEAEVVDAAIATVPVDVLPLPCDTKETLTARIAASSFLEDSHILKGGSGPQRVRLNATSYPQPRRRSWSVIVDQDDEQITLLNYTAYGRLAQDWESVPMPRPIFTLGCCCWHTAYALLTEQSKAKPPTGCQLLLYYTLFESCIGIHRDNYNKKHFGDVAAGRSTASAILEGNHHGGDANSQLLGSNVLIYTFGDADMTFALCFCPPGDHNANLESYIVHPIFCTQLGAGTLLVFHPLDDLFFSHKAWFGDPKSGTFRGAFVYRWLTQPRRFRRSDSKMILTPKLEQAAADRKQSKRRRADRDRRSGLRGVW
jgi:hypothetical protein